MVSYKFFAYICVLAGTLLSLPVAAQTISTQADMHARIKEVYDFSPSKITAEQRERKSAEMDSFWKEINSHKESDLPLLKKELQDDSNPAFFFADGSSLLLSLSQSAEDEVLVARCLARINFDDFQSRQYLYEVHGLATKGIDVTAAAFHMLDDPKFEVYLPEHGAYRLDQAACLLEALLPLPEGVWLPVAMRKIKDERNATALRSLVLLLYYAQTDDADASLRSIVANPNVSKDERDFTITVLKHERQLGMGKQPSRPREIEIREQRRRRMFGVSDEAMDDLEDLTQKLAQARATRKSIP